MNIMLFPIAKEQTRADAEVPPGTIATYVCHDPHYSGLSVVLVGGRLCVIDNSALWGEGP